MSLSKEKETRRFTGTIPEDLIRYILLRVPSIKTLVGLKSVSKSWLALISSPNFAKSHLAITAAEEKEDIHIVCTYANADGSEDSISLINFGTRQLVTRLNFPSVICDKLVGSACGIVCIRTTIADLHKMYLWNPATNHSKPIPYPSSLSHDEALGFGFDGINNDFKIVRITWQLKPTCYPKKYYVYNAQDCEQIYVEVYSSNRNAWRKLRVKPTDIPYKYGNFDVSVNTGFLCSAGCYGIISFDLHSEVLTCGAVNYPVPTFDANINNFNTLDVRAVITNFKDSIAVIIYKDRHNNPYDDTCMFNLWALDNVACLRGGGIEASWTLIFNIDVDLPIDRVHSYLKSGDFLLYLLADYNLCLYNSDSEEPRYFTHSFYFGQIFKYSKSLFTISGFKPVNWNVPPES